MLMKVVLWEYKKLVKLLIDAGANIFIKNNTGKTALDLAECNEIKKLLVKATKKY